MNKGKKDKIKTAEANLDLVRKFLDYANCADASQVKLAFVIPQSVPKLYKQDYKNYADKEVA